MNAPKLLFLLLLPFLAIACSNDRAAKVGDADHDSIRPKAEKAPEFPDNTEWLNTGKAYKLADFKGKFVLLDFWTYCCINCMHVIPDLKKLEKEYPELLVIGVHSAKFSGEKSTENIKEAILRYEIEHPVINDHSFVLWDKYKVKAWPSFVLIDPEGNRLKNFSGEGIYERLKPVLDKERGNYSGINRERISFNLIKFSSPASVLSYPSGIAANPKKRSLFISDSNNDRIIEINESGEILNVIGGMKGSSDGSFEAASFNRPQGLAYDELHDILYVADTENHLLRKVDIKKQLVSTILGSGKQAKRLQKKGKGRDLDLSSPWGLALYNNKVWIAMAGSHQIWTLNLENGEAELYAGSGRENLKDAARLEAELAQPSALFHTGKTLYFLDSETSSLRLVQDATVKTLIGKGLFVFGDSDGDSVSGRLQHPLGLSIYEDKIYIADTYNNKIREYNLKTRKIRSLAGSTVASSKDGKGPKAGFNEPNAVAFLNKKLYITDTNNGLIRVYDPASGIVSTLQLRKMEKMLAQMPREEYTGKLAKLNGIELNGKGSVITLKLLLGENFKINEEAPSSVEAFSEPSIMKTGEVEIDPAKKIIRIPVEYLKGSTILKLDLGIFYCSKDENAKCFIERIRLEIPVKVTSSKSSPQIEYKIN